MAAGGLRQLSERERLVINEFSARHGQVRGLNQAVVDSAGGAGLPMVRVPLLTRLEHRGAITSTELAAGERFAALFRLAQIDPLRSADMGRAPAAAGYREASLSLSGEHARRQVSAALVALGGAGSPAAGAAWNILGMEMTVAGWARAVQRSNELAAGVLIAALGVLVGHFGERRQRRAHELRRSS